MIIEIIIIGGITIASIWLVKRDFDNTPETFYEEDDEG